jgi:hypothetical protein
MRPTDLWFLLLQSTDIGHFVRRLDSFRAQGKIRVFSQRGGIVNWLFLCPSVNLLFAGVRALEVPEHKFNSYTYLLLKDL